ncbi:hypothetical protein CIL05_14210 [Virgibacillus profundi]|uniref:Uncharacterized protein n=1 Tax=Virgibacillus profundi TaxID=2024555 RepID=A0A2A2IBL8_9BACI|nr:penicillin-binding protein [Virgibacillus profundi]PAV28778.1 hypothetical protein CIL05_14210 [Virgibacillus profundi]PXY52946.1 penicillin-binding protein [Virgibacillus profundi]
MNYPNIYQYGYRSFGDQDERVFPVIPFLTGLAFGPLLYGAFHQGGYHPYPPYPPYPSPYPYGYGYEQGYNPYYHNGYY